MPATVAPPWPRLTWQVWRGLIWAEDPSLTAAEVKQIIMDSVDPLAALDGITVSGGRLNAYNALSMVGVPGTHTVDVTWDQDVAGINFGNREILPGSISGYKWHDLDSDGVWDNSEDALANWTIFIDADQDGVLDEGETSTVTDANGLYLFTGLNPGTYTIAEVQQANWVPTYPVTPGRIRLDRNDLRLDRYLGCGNSPGSLGRQLLRSCPAIHLPLLWQR